MAIEKVIGSNAVGDAFGKYNATVDEIFTGGTFNQVSGILTLNKFGGGTYSVTGFSGSDIYVNSGSYNPSTGTLTLQDSTGGTIITTGFFKPSDDIYISGSTFNTTGGTLTFTNSTGGTFNVSVLSGDTTSIISTGNTISIKDSGVTETKMANNSVSTRTIINNNVTHQKLEKIPNDTFLGRSNGGVTGSTTGNTEVLSIIQEVINEVPTSKTDYGIRGQKVMMDSQLAFCYLPNEWAWLPRANVKTINLKTIGNTIMITNYTGKTFIPLMDSVTVEIEDTFVAGGGSVDPTITIGNNAPDYNNLVTGYTMSSPTGNTVYHIPLQNKSLSVDTSNDILYFRVSGASNYTTISGRVILMGITI